MRPGATALTLIFLEPNSFASGLAQAKQAGFRGGVAGFDRHSRTYRRCCVTSTIEPERCFIIGFATRRSEIERGFQVDVEQAVERLARKRMSSPSMDWPALATAQSMRPKRLREPATASSTAW